MAIQHHPFKYVFGCLGQAPMGLKLGTFYVRCWWNCKQEAFSMKLFKITHMKPVLFAFHVHLLGIRIVKPAFAQLAVEAH